MKTILLTRPQRQSIRTAARLWEKGWKSRLSPLFVVEELPFPALEAARYQAVLVTSANAAFALAGLRDKLVYAVGDATAEAARAEGVTEVATAAGDAGALLTLLREKLKPEAGPLLYLAGRERAMDIPARAKELGFEVELVEVYAARPAGALSPETVSELNVGHIAATLLYSARAASRFRELADAAGVEISAQNIICLSEKVALAAGEGWKNVRVAERPNENALLEALYALPEECYTAEMTASTSRSSGLSRAALIISLLALGAAGSSPFWAPRIFKLPPPPASAAYDDSTLLHRLSELQARLDDMQQSYGRVSAAVEELKASSQSQDKAAEVLSRLDTLTQRLGSLESASSHSRNLEKNLTSLSSAVDEMRHSLSTRKEADAATRTRLAATLQFTTALQSGEPFSTAWSSLRAVAEAGDEPLSALLQTASSVLDAYRDKGVPTRASLLAAFPAAARAALAAAQPAPQSWWDASLDSVKGLVTVRRQGADVAGDDVEARTARAEADLKAGDLKAALAELAPLPPENMAEWRRNAAARLAAEKLASDLTGETAAGLLPANEGTP